MGLDMYLMKKMDDGEDKQIMYWRKANMIHNWFIKNANIDENVTSINCVPIRVDKGDLKELRDDIECVLQDHTRAEEILPTCAGFFFGDTEYNHYYYEELFDTYLKLGKLIKELRNDGSEIYYMCWF